MRALTQISRILVGVLFIISGFIKANDTIGFSYKLVEYFEIFNMHFFVDYAVSMAMFICIFEIMVGVALLLGAYTRLNMWLLLLMIVFFTMLTGYSAITNKVTDCGCFGDAIKLKPVESFLKDVVLLVFIVIMFIGQKHIKPIVANKTIIGIALGVSLLVTTFFTFNTYMFLPKIDFLPYKVGNDIGQLMTLPEGAKKDSVAMIFIYEKDGKVIYDSSKLNDNASIALLFDIFDIDSQKLADGLNEYVTKEGTEKSWTKADIDDEKFKKLLASSLGYGYYYVRETKPNEVKVVPLLTAENANDAVGKITKAEVKYPGPNTKQLTMKIDTDSPIFGPSQYQVSVRNTSGKLLPLSLRVSKTK